MVYSYIDDKYVHIIHVNLIHIWIYGHSKCEYSNMGHWSLFLCPQYVHINHLEIVPYTILLAKTSKLVCRKQEDENSISWHVPMRPEWLETVSWKKSRRKTFRTTRNRPESCSEVQLESQQECVTGEAFATVLGSMPRGRGLEEAAEIVLPAVWIQPGFSLTF